MSIQENKVEGSDSRRKVPVISQQSAPRSVEGDSRTPCAAGGSYLTVAYKSVGSQASVTENSVKSPPLSDVSLQSDSDPDHKCDREGCCYNRESRREKRKAGPAKMGTRGARANLAIGQSIDAAVQQKLGEEDAKRELEKANQQPIEQPAPEVKIDGDIDPAYPSLYAVHDDKLKAWGAFEEQVKMVYYQISGGAPSDKAYKTALSRMGLWLNKFNLETEIDYSTKAFNIITRVNTQTIVTPKKVNYYLAFCAGFLYLTFMCVYNVPFEISVYLGWVHIEKQSMWTTCYPMLLGYLLYWSWWYFKPASVTVVSFYSTVTDYCARSVGNPKQMAGRIWEKAIGRMVCVPKNFRIGFSINLPSLWLPRLCTCNEKIALMWRQLLPAIGTAEVRKQMWTDAADLLTELLPTVPNKFELFSAEMWEAFLSRYPLKRRLLIKKAWEGVLLFGDAVTSYSKAFVKPEWLLGKDEAKRHPRLISGKDDAYLASTGPEYYTWSKTMCEVYWPVRNHMKALEQNVIYTGGFTGDQLGDFVSYFEHLGWYAYEGDFSRYDGHNEKEALEGEFRYYASHLSPQILNYLNMQLETKGSTMHGLGFSHSGKVASGVINTSFGNSIRGFMMFAWMMKKMGIQKNEWRLMQLGDDNLLFCKKQLKVDQMIKYAELFGHKLEMVERLPNAYDFLEYCSMRFWDTGFSRVLGPKPFRTLSKTFMPHRQMDASEVMGHMKGVAVGFKHYSWIPVLGQFCRRLIRDVTADPRYVHENPYKVMLRQSIDVEQQAVERQFLRIYGVTAYDACQWMQDLPQIRAGMVVEDALLYELCLIDGARTEDGSDFVLSETM